MERHPPATRKACAPRWGDLVAQVVVEHVLDVHAFEQWGLVYAGGRGRAASTVRQHVRAIDYLQRAGFRWPRFLACPDEALDEVGRFLAPFQRESERELVRNYKKTFNWVAAFLAQKRPEYRDVHWELPHSQPVEPRRQLTNEIQDLLLYRHVDDVLDRRRCCLIWFCVHTGLRRGEIGDIHLENLDQVHGVLYVGRPRKNGKRRAIPLPDDAWHPDGPLMRWLEVRKTPRDGSAWLWTTWYHGPVRRMTGDSLANDLTAVGEELGFPVSFTRIRHWRGKTLRKRYGQAIEIVQAVYGHGDPKTTMRYVDDVDAEDQRASFVRGGVPGYSARGTVTAMSGQVVSFVPGGRQESVASSAVT